MKLDKKYIYLITTLVVLVLVGSLGYLYYSKTANKSATNNPASNQAVKAEACAKLTANEKGVEGIAPFSPVLSSKLTGSFDKAKQICEWSLDGQSFGKSFPINDTCMFGNKALATAGKHVISLKVTDKTCSAKLEVIVK